MNARLNSISRAAVLAAMDEFVRLGRDEFLRKYHFGRARNYFVRHPSRAALCDSKAIVGAAYGYQHPGEQPLRPADFSGGEATVAELLRNLGFELEVIEADPAAGRREWSRREVELLVADYLQMLAMELSGQSFNKAQRRRALLPLLDQRSESSIEFKRRNVSAVMGRLGYPYVRGYLPAENAESDILLDVIASQIDTMPLLESAAAAFVELPAVENSQVDYARSRTTPPVRRSRVQEPLPAFRARTPVKRDYLEREARNRSLGAAGEKFILDFERWRLQEFGVGQLAERVRHVAALDGDGAGYDILSFEPDGRERYIEVKTTAFGETTPFFVSANEVSFARTCGEQFRLCRVFEFRAEPKFFELAGPIEQHVYLDPSTYRASLN